MHRLPERTCWRLAALGGVALLLGPAPLTAQSASARFDITGIQRLFCVNFLVEPGQAAEMLGSRFRPIIAGEASSLASPIRMLIDGEPEYATWVPGQVCMLEAGAIKHGTEVASEVGKRVAMGWAALRAREASAPPSDASSWRTLEYFSSDRVLRRQVRDALVNMDGGDFEVGEAIGNTTDERVRLKAGGTELIWEGRVAGENAPARATRQLLMVDGRRNDLWASSMDLTPVTERPLVGTLQIQGKSVLAEAMKASPIRMVGPLQSGGTGVIAFARP